MCKRVVLITMKVACPPVSALDVGFKLSEYLALNSFLLSLMALSLVYDAWQVALLVFSPGLRTECSVCWSTSERAAHKRPPVQHFTHNFRKKFPRGESGRKVGEGRKEWRSYKETRDGSRKRCAILEHPRTNGTAHGTARQVFKSSHQFAKTRRPL